jgi:hypothetical protein
MRGYDAVDRMLQMMTMNGFRVVVVGFGLMGLVGVVGCGHAGMGAGQPASAMAPESGGEGGAAAVVMVREIHVNQDCLILQDPVDGVMGVSVPNAQPVGGGAAGVSGQRAVAQTETGVCHLESQLTSNSVKGAVVNGAVQRSVVVVKEQKYMLRDEFQEPVVFVVEQAVPDGWMVSSDPQPNKVEGKVALFRVAAQPGQVVSLHVGEQHTIPLAQ